MIGVGGSILIIRLDELTLLYSFCHNIPKDLPYKCSRFRRILRFFYQSFDRVVALNSDVYNVKVARDMNRNGKVGLLVNNRQEMGERMIEFLI
jgi:hypothetical protein